MHLFILLALFVLLVFVISRSCRINKTGEACEISTGQHEAEMQLTYDWLHMDTIRREWLHSEITDNNSLNWCTGQLLERLESAEEQATLSWNTLVEAKTNIGTLLRKYNRELQVMLSNTIKNRPHDRKTIDAAADALASEYEKYSKGKVKPLLVQHITQTIQQAVNIREGQCLASIVCYETGVLETSRKIGQAIIRR